MNTYYSTLPMDAADVNLVTGASGFIGSNLVDRLTDQGQKVRALHRSPAPGDRYPQSGLAVEQRGDITDIDSLHTAMDGCSRVFHLAGYARNWARDPRTYWKINVDGLKNVLDVARESGVRRVVWTSSVMALGPTPPGQICDETYHCPGHLRHTHYEFSKLEAEKLARSYVTEFGMEVITVNPTRVFGPGPLTEGNALAKLMNDYDLGRAPFLLNGGRNVGNFVYVQDVVQGLLLAMRHGRPGERYVLGGENKTLKEFLDTLDSVSGKRHFRVTVRWPLSLSTAYLMQWRAKWFGIHPPITPPWVRSFMSEWAYSSKKAADELGYHPMPLEESIGLTYDWLIQQRG